MMRTAIVYYSMSGNTEYVANKIKEQMDADLIKLLPVKEYPDKGIMKFFWGGKSAVMGEKPELVPFNFNANNYDAIIIGTPVWASNFVPPIRSFVETHKDIAGKKLAAFVCYSGGGADKALDKLKKQVGVDNFAAELILVDPAVKVKPENDTMIEAFCRKLGR